MCTCVALYTIRHVIRIAYLTLFCFYQFHSISFYVLCAFRAPNMEQLPQNVCIVYTDTVIWLTCSIQLIAYEP